MVKPSGFNVRSQSADEHGLYTLRGDGSARDAINITTVSGFLDEDALAGSTEHGFAFKLLLENGIVLNFTTQTWGLTIVLHEEERKAEVYLRPEEVSLAIGKGGMNIKLASMLTEYTIDVFREVEGAEETEDIYLDEFSDEIDQWVIDAIKALGLETAKDVLNAPREMLIEKADLEEDTVDELLRVLRAEFDTDEQDAPAEAEQPAGQAAEAAPEEQS